MRLRNRIGPVAVAFAAITAVSTASAQAQQPADLIVVNAEVRTLDEQRPEATAFAVKDGKFVAVGGKAEVEAYRTWNPPEAAAIAELYAHVSPNYAVVVEKAQEVAGEQSRSSADQAPKQ